MSNDGMRRLLERSALRNTTLARRMCRRKRPLPVSRWRHADAARGDDLRGRALPSPKIHGMGDA
jgi:hypothetical protein